MRGGGHQHRRLVLLGRGTHGHTDTHKLSCRAGPAEAPPRRHVRAMCSAHGRAGGAAPAFLTGGSFDKSRFPHAPGHGRRPRVPLAKRWGPERARRFGFLLLQRLFFFSPAVNLAKPLTKPFGLNRVGPNESSRRGGLRRPFVLRSAFAPRPKGGFIAPLASRMHPSAGPGSVPPAVP